MTQQNWSNFSLNINLCVNNLSHLSFGPVGANVRFFSWIYSNQKTIRTNIRIYSYQKNDTNEYPNIFVSNKWYEYNTNEYLYWKIFKYTNIFITNFWYYVSDLDLVNSVILKTWWFWQTWCTLWIWWFLKIFQFSF